MKESRLRSHLTRVLSVVLLGLVAVGLSQPPAVQAQPGSWFRSPQNLTAARRLAKQQGKPLLILLR